jgi:hypothetical protein
VSDYLERFLGVGHDPSPTARFDRLASKIQGAITHSRVGVLDFPSGRVYRRNTLLRWMGDQGLDNTSSKPYLRNSDIMGVLEYPLETINITESSTSLRRAATSLPPIPRRQRERVAARRGRFRRSGRGKRLRLHPPG